MRDRLRREIAALAADRPGERFVRHYQRRRNARREHPVLSAAYLGVGLGLIAVGAALSLIPAIPGIVLGLPGLGMIAARSRFMAVVLDRSEAGIRRAVAALRRRRD